MVIRRLGVPALLLGAAFAVGGARAQSPRFDINEYVVEGNTLLDASRIEASVAPFRGKQRDFADIQKALEALEEAYRALGYTAVSVQLPEQEVEQGRVRFRIVEGRLGTVAIEGNRYYGNENVRAALPALLEGKVPNARLLSENLQLANENPARQFEVELAVGEQEGRLDARVRVSDEKPWKAFVTVDNTGNAATGWNRTGIALQHANLFGLDHVGTLAYTGSLDRPGGVKVDIWSLGYRVPFYQWGDSLDVIYGESNVGTPANSPALGGAIGIVGKGRVGSVRWNHLFPRSGEYSSRVVLAVDYRDMKNGCVPVPVAPIAGCVDYLVAPVSATYQARIDQTMRVIAYSAGVAVNAMSSSATTYDFASSNRTAPRNFGVLRGTLNVVQLLPGEWQFRVNVQAQMAQSALLPTEQIALAGYSAVRGFTERAFAADKGYVAQLEILTPELAAHLGLPGSFRLLGFYDVAEGGNINTPITSTGRFPLASAGIGARYQLRRDVNWRFDLANVRRSPLFAPGGAPVESGWRAHFGLALGF